MELKQLEKEYTVHVYEFHHDSLTGFGRNKLSCRIRLEWREQ